MSFLSALQGQYEVDAVQHRRSGSVGKRGGLAQLDCAGSPFPCNLQRGIQERGFCRASARQDPRRIEERKRDEFAMAAENVLGSVRT